MKSALAILTMGMAFVALAEKQPLERYQSIIDRQMFGPLPKDFDPNKMPSEVTKGSGSMSEKELTKEQEKLQSSIHFSVINVDHDGKTVVGFTDNSDPKAPVHYYMRAGETQNGWTVREADPSEATMTIVKDDVEVSLKLGDNSGAGGGKTASASPSKSPSEARRGLFGGMGSLKARREARAQAAREAAQKQAAENAEKEAARQAQAEQREAEREAERQQQRQQLQAIQEELRKAREEKERQRQSEGGDGADNVE